jgi:hypothetical protein
VATPLRPRRYRDIHPTRRGLVLSWWSFTVTFAGLRVLTLLIHLKVRGLGNVTAGGLHIHHFVWGIIILAIVATLGLVERSDTWRVWMGVALGFGLALVVDEAALLVELKDVYWDRQGAASVAAAIVLIGVVGSVLVMTRSPHINSVPDADADPDPAPTP